MTLLLAFLLLGLGAFYAWRYAKTDIDPDWALFNLYAFTGSVYGKDFLDCKSPGVHLWYAALARLFGADVGRVKFANHFLISVPGAIYFLATGDFFAALAFVVLVNAGSLLAFHGTTGSVPAALLFLALGSPNAWISAALIVLAACYQPKLGLTALLFVSRWPLQITASFALILVILVLLYAARREWFSLLTFQTFRLPERMHAARRKDAFYRPFLPWFTREGLVYFLPWVAFAVLAKPDFMFWLPALAYWLLLGVGGVIRQNHLLPLVPFVAASVGANPLAVLALTGVDWISAGFYCGDIWQRFYAGLRDALVCAKEAGAWLRDKRGAVWVNGISTEVYIHARKAVPYGLAEQIEIREAATERREAMLTAWRADPPDWIVQGPQPALKLNPTGYQVAHRNEMFCIYQRVVGGTHDHNGQNAA